MPDRNRKGILLQASGAVPVKLLLDKDSSVNLDMSLQDAGKEPLSWLLPKDRTTKVDMSFHDSGNIPVSLWPLSNSCHMLGMLLQDTGKLPFRRPLRLRPDPAITLGVIESVCKTKQSNGSLM